MAKPVDRIAATALGVAFFLDGIGERKRANDIRRLHRSNAGLRSELQFTMREARHLRALMESKAHG